MVSVRRGVVGILWRAVVLIPLDPVAEEAVDAGACSNFPVENHLEIAMP